MKTSEKELHKSRIAFAILKDKIIYLANSEMSHKEWLITSKLIEEKEFNEIIRGYIKHNNIYFYKGDFLTDKSVENSALEYCFKIHKENNLKFPAKIYCGMQKGKIGIEWKPKKLLKIITTL
ncbi:hypothetical protein Q3304_09070 [Clostridioides sp. GD02377]|uniref:hypothetical protein n=1 Tax=unclassified Clostridioides TaxID=2635829 RepID=UPI0038B0267D